MGNEYGRFCGGAGTVSVTLRYRPLCPVLTVRFHYIENRRENRFPKQKVNFVGV